MSTNELFKKHARVDHRRRIMSQVVVKPVLKYQVESCLDRPLTTRRNIEL